MKRLPDGILVVMDEAYYEYVADPEYADSMKYFGEGRDILILRTFSKIYGLAGLRIGYGIARNDIITEINKLRPPFNTNSIAQIAALHALQDEAHIKASREINEQGKQYLYRELSALGIQYVPTEANFIFMTVEDAQALNNLLLRQGVIVRPMGPGAIRVTIGLLEENKRFIEALKKIQSGQ
jgi:histidinol-phosphate aminotransferase